MRAGLILGRVTAVCIGVPVSASLLYALVVPAFLGGEESAREALLQATSLVTLLALLAVGALPFRYLVSTRRAARSVALAPRLSHAPEARRTEPPPAALLDEGDRARLYAAPREGAALLALVAAAVLAAAGVYLVTDPNRAHAVAAVVGAAFAMTASLVFYPAMRRAQRPLFEALAPSDAPAAQALGDRLPLRIALAVAVPSGVAALFAAQLVAAHVAATAQSEEELNARMFSLALGVRRMPGEAPDCRDAAARVLAAGGARVTTGVELPLVEADAPQVPSPLGALLAGLAFAGVGAVLGLRIGRRATHELGHATRRVETVGLLKLAPAERSLSAFTFTAELLSLPEVRAISRTLDRVTEALAAMARDQRRAVTARAEAARLRSFVLAGVSHDLRGPLNSVLGFAGLLLSGVDGELTAGQRESLEALSRGGNDLLRLVDDLLDAARLDAGRMNLARARVRVADLVADARKAALERAGPAVHEDVRLPADGDLDLDAVVDRERMARHLGALLAYALLRKGAAPPSGAAAPVTMRVRAVDEATWSLTVTALGATPSREMLQQLFDPFDLPPSGARAPAGLGLALGVARRVIELHGGSARAEAAPEGGLAMHVTLPRARPRVLSPSPLPPAAAPSDGMAGPSEA